MLRRSIVALAMGVVLLPAAAPARQAPQRLDRVTRIIVAYLESQSSDNLFGESPGADGIANALATNGWRQRDRNGDFHDALPAPRGPGPFDVSDNSKEIRGSILKFITERFALEPPPSPRVQTVNSLSGALKLD